MGTNFYFIPKEIDDFPFEETHIGKRSSAGLFCHNCYVSLIEDKPFQQPRVLSHCPVCQNKNTKPFITTTCSFTFAKQEKDIQKICDDNLNNFIIENEYGEQFTGKDLFDILYHDCKIHEYHLIGEYFC